MKRFCIVMDASRCIACRACEAHCATKNGLPEGMFLGRLATEGPFLESGRVVMRSDFQTCQSCEPALCVAACPVNADGARAMRRDADGTVYIDAATCIGCGLCAKACPFDMVKLMKRAASVDADVHVDMDAKPRSKRVAIKCDLCRDLRADGGLPACVTACTAHALSLKVSP